MKALRSQKYIDAILLADKHRKAGSFKNADGKVIEYDDAYQVVALPIGEIKYFRKYTVAADKEDTVSKKLSDSNYGAFVRMETDANGLIVDIDVLYDYLAGQDK